VTCASDFYRKDKRTLQYVLCLQIQRDIVTDTMPGMINIMDAKMEEVNNQT
jgi:hypothetical protein